MRGRPRKLQHAKPFIMYLDYDMYKSLKELSQIRNIPMAELIRNAIEDFLIREQLINPKKMEQAVAGCLTLKQKIRENYYEMELDEKLSELETYIHAMGKYEIYRKKPDLHFHELKGSAQKLIKEILSIVDKMHKPNPEKIRKIVELQERFMKLKNAYWWKWSKR